MLSGMIGINNIKLNWCKGGGAYKITQNHQYRFMSEILTLTLKFKRLDFWYFQFVGLGQDPVSFWVFLYILPSPTFQFYIVSPNHLNFLSTLLICAS